MTIETSFIVIHILDPNLRLSQRYNGGRAPFQFMQRMKPRRERGECHDERRHEYKFEYMYYEQNLDRTFSKTLCKRIVYYHSIFICIYVQVTILCKWIIVNQWRKCNFLLRNISYTNFAFCEYKRIVKESIGLSIFISFGETTFFVKLNAYDHYDIEVKYVWILIAGLRSFTHNKSKI